MSKYPTLYPHQQAALEKTEGFQNVAYYLDMGLGKTFVGSEKAYYYANHVILVICQKSKVDDWVNHFDTWYNHNPEDMKVYNCTKWNKDDWENLKADPLFLHDRKLGCDKARYVLVINYELAFRRTALSSLKYFTMILDESSMIQNETTKRSKFILRKLHPEHTILLSGTPTAGKYEKLWSQMHLLGWPITKTLYYRQFVNFVITPDGYPIINGYKNVDRLKSKMREYGCIFMKTEDVIDLPDQNFQTINVDTTKEYRKFKKDRIIVLKDGTKLIGDTSLTKLLYSRMLCGQYNEAKLGAIKDILKSTDDRLIIFYNFKAEFELLKNICEEYNRPISVINGDKRDLQNYETAADSVTLVQYQAGAMGVNLQKANKLIYFTPTLSSELFEQSKKRIHRIGQNKPCMYYMLTCGIENRIYETLKMRKDYTDELFREDDM